MKKTLQKVRDTINRYEMLRSGDRIVVAVSGGPDSACLLDILYCLRHELGVKLYVAHFDHGLRPGEDEEETRFVESLAKSLDLPFMFKKADPGYEGAGPIEERARNARYDFFSQAVEEFSARKIATGHTLNDQSETVLMRMLRGSGVTGLAGIPPVRNDTVIRPLIHITRKEILDYLEGRGLSYVTDSSNSETRFLRNRIRRELLPQLQEIQPRVVELLGRTAEIMRSDDAWMSGAAEEWIAQKARIRQGREVSIPLMLFKLLPDAMKSRVIRHALKLTTGTLRKINMGHIEEATRLTLRDKPQACINLPDGLRVQRIYDRLVFTREEKKTLDEFSYTLDSWGSFHLEVLGCTVTVQECDKTEIAYEPSAPWTAFLNADQLPFPLEVRNFRAGDRFVPLGMSGHRKLKDFFIDLKIPLEDRTRIPILTHGKQPVWVCGFRIDERYRVTDRTRKVLKVAVDGMNLNVNASTPSTS